MKSLPGLPLLPPGCWWEINPSRLSDSFKVSLMTSEVLGRSTISRAVAWELTRGWPRPTARTIVRTAKVVHNRWLRQNSRMASNFTGQFRGQ